MSFSIIEHQGVRFAEVLPSDCITEETQFFSPPGAGFQLGLLANPAGRVEAPHFHDQMTAVSVAASEFLFIRSGAMTVFFYDREGAVFHQVRLTPGDAIVLLDGAHSYRVDDDVAAIVIKQGPFADPLNKHPVQTC